MPDLEAPSMERRLRPRDHFHLSAFWFGVNLLWGALLIVIIPAQMRQIAPHRPVETMDLMLGLGAIPAVVVPLLVGPLSDRCLSRLGRRRPYMLAGVAINLIGLAMVWWAGLELSLWIYFAGYLVVQVGNNIATGAYSGMIPDQVPRGQRGLASGWMAAMSQIGTMFGLLTAGILMSSGRAGLSLAVTAASLVVFCLLTVTGVREQPRKAKLPPMDWLAFVRSLWVDPRKHPDFAWVWITRALVVMGLWMVQQHLQFYLVDVMGLGQSEVPLVAAKVFFVSLICAAITGVVGGRISDRIGRKRVVYLSNAVIALDCLAFTVAPSLEWVYVLAAVFGMGYGAYYSVDWALACDVLPNADDAAKDMAVWHIAMVLPQSIALPISGAVLGAWGHHYTIAANGDKITHYFQSGYTAMFSLAALFLLLGAFFIRNVRSVR
jgi:MFS family permease